MHSQEQPQKSDGFSLSDTITLVYWGAFIWALPWELLLRRGFGRNYFGITLVIAAIWPMLFASFVCPQYDMTWSILLFWGILALTVYQRGVSLWYDQQGRVRHSMYGGDSVLCSFLRLDEQKWKGRCEVNAMLVLTFFCFVICPPMGTFLLGGIAAAIVKLAISETYQKEEVSALHDAYIEQQNLAERFRKNR